MGWSVGRSLGRPSEVAPPPTVATTGTRPDVSHPPPVTTAAAFGHFPDNGTGCRRRNLSDRWRAEAAGRPPREWCGSLGTGIGERAGMTQRHGAHTDVAAKVH